jgi:hypothetical protein
MGRKVAILWHASFSIAAGVLYFFFVLPRWHELMGDTTHGLGTTLRIVTGALIALAALPVVFTLLRTRKPELGTPQLALSIRVWSIVGHVLSGVLIIGTAISEIWLSLDAAGQYLFAIYGAAAATGILGFLAFYLSFVAELPPPPPKPLKAKKPKERRRRKKGEEAADEEAEAIEDTDETEDADEVESEEAETVDAKAAQQTEEAQPEPADEPTEVTADASTADSTGQATAEADEPRSGLRNRRPTGKGSHRMRRRTRGGVAVDEAPDE